MTTPTFSIIFRAYGEIARVWPGYATYEEARRALRDADLTIPIHWDHEITNAPLPPQWEN